jgi:hypothetical protein
MKKFDAPRWLRRHLARKTPCDPVVRPEKKEDKGPDICPSCNRVLATKQAKSRHIHEHCKAQNERADEKLGAFDPPWDRDPQLDQKVQALQLQVAELLRQKKSNTGEKQNWGPDPHGGFAPNFQATNVIVNNGPVIHTTNNSKTQNIDNSYKILNLNNNRGGVNQQITNFMPGPAAPTPGWPSKWPPPQIDPKPFYQGSFATTLAQLRQASERLTAEEVAACQQGDAKAVSALLMEVLRQVHTDPRERNIYLSPDRGDQALIFVLHQWELNTLHEAMRSIFERMVKELPRLPAHSAQHVKTLAAGAKEGFQRKPADVVQSSNSAMTAHLKNMQALLRVPGQIKATEEVGWEAGDEPPREFGRESYEHIDLKSTIYRMELDAGVDNEKDIVEERFAELARRAVYSLAWQVQQLRAPNQTAVLLSEDEAVVHTFDGWERWPSADVGEKIFRLFAEVTADFVRGDEPTPLKPLGHYIEAHMAILASAERQSLALLRQYSVQAGRVCETSTNPEFAKLKALMQAAKTRSLLASKGERADGKEDVGDILDALGWT